MPTYTLKQLGDEFGVSDRTVYNWVKKLEKQRKFKKTAIGRSFNDEDKNNLFKLLKFKKPKETNGNE